MLWRWLEARKWQEHDRDVSEKTLTWEIRVKCPTTVDRRWRLTLGVSPPLSLREAAVWRVLKLQNAWLCSVRTPGGREQMATSRTGCAFPPQRCCSVCRQCYLTCGESPTATALSVISGFRRDVDEICALLGCYAASIGNPLPTFRDNVSVPSWRGKKSRKERKPTRRYAVYKGGKVRVGTENKPGTQTWFVPDLYKRTLQNWVQLL
jgi:hypothetical protein